TSNYKIVANLPYYITSRFLRLFLESDKLRPQATTLMVQKEVAERICAKPPHMNLLALSVQAFGTPKILFKVRRGSFSPPPEVESAVIEIAGISDAFFKKNRISPQEFFKLPKKAFSQKRKMLRASLKISETELPKFSSKRPQELDLEDWIEISKL
ncbi:MAG: 16S rRNA (adenine1518-N6/adenine1519-N6)-dimethyltransferase, partial [Parcubacteria group bacterium Gr01-1014_70]